MTRFQPAELRAQYRTVRQTTERLCNPLETDDFQVRSVPEVSPPKWHLAHTTWFFETFVLRPFLPGYREFHPLFSRLFNSYYESVGPFLSRDSRHTLSRPTVADVFRYRAHVDENVGSLLERCPEHDRPALGERITLGLHHEQQHQELLLMDVKRNFLANPLLPAYSPATPAPAGSAPLRWLDFAGGLREVGHAGADFAFDNERPRHKVYLEDYRLGSRLVTNGEFLEFVEDGGYAEPALWLSDGRKALREGQWFAPLYWQPGDDGWQEMTLNGPGPLDPAAPVCHLSYYEADAYARWRGCRLPREEEWEAATAGRPVAGNFLESGLLRPRAALDGEDDQWFGDLWEWTASPYTPYPGFRALEGSLGEYNGKFMANQFVLRGGCCVTPRPHFRGTYRNFYYPQDRWPFTGLRLAADIV